MCDDRRFSGQGSKAKKLETRFQNRKSGKGVAEWAEGETMYERYSIVFSKKISEKKFSEKIYDN